MDEGVQIPGVQARRHHHSLVSHVRRLSAARLAATGFKLRPAWQHAADCTAYTSVQAFKGLENKVIILTDVVLGEPHFHRHLFYTGRRGQTNPCASAATSARSRRSPAG